MESKHFILKCSLKIKDKLVQTHILIDCRATGIAFVNKDFVHHQGLKEKELNVTRKLKVIDKRPIESGTITTIVKMNLGIKGHREELPAFIMKLGYYPIVLGLSWLQLQDIIVKF